MSAWDALPLVPVAVGSTHEWKKANALASALHAGQRFQVSNDVAAESVWCDEVQMRRMLSAVHQGKELKQSRCGATPSRDHWSLRAGSNEQHACSATLSVNKDNEAYAKSVTVEGEAPAGNRRAKAGTSLGREAGSLSPDDEAYREPARVGYNKGRL